MASEEEYEGMWRKETPSILRKFVVPFVMWYQGAWEIAPYCERVRSVWEA
jgi:hypothetical protein